MSATFVATSSGAITDVAAAGSIVRAAGVRYFVDACQAVGQIPVDVEAIGCDVLTSTGRKWLREPPGIDATSARWVDLASLADVVAQR